MPRPQLSSAPRWQTDAVLPPEQYFRHEISSPADWLLFYRDRDSRALTRPPHELLALAACLGDYPLVDALLAKLPGTDATARRSKGTTALHEAACRGHSAIVASFLESGAVRDVDAVDAWGRTALAVAAAEGHSAVVECLLEAGHAAIDARDADGLTPLQLAVSTRPAHRGRVDTVDALIRRGADILDPTPEGGGPAISLAAQADMGALVRLMADKHQADWCARDRFGQTPLWNAAVDDCRDAARQLLWNNMGKTGGVDAQCGKRGETALAAAVARNHEVMVRILLDHDADTETRTNEGETPLHIAVRSNHESITRLLITRGANMAAQLHGRTPLNVAEGNGSQKLINLLRNRQFRQEEAMACFLSAVEHGRLLEVRRWLSQGVFHADPEKDSPGSVGQSALSRAAMNGHGAIVDLLLDHGAAVDGRDWGGHTALWWASWRGHARVASQLLDRGAGVDIPDACDVTPISAAARRGHEDLVALFRERGAYEIRKDTRCRLDGHGDCDEPSDKREACGEAKPVPVSGDIDHHQNTDDPGISEPGRANLLWDYSKDPEANDMIRELAILAGHGRVPAVKRLIRAGADVNGADANPEHTPLILAAMESHVGVMETLLDHGAGLEARDVSGRTPLWAAAADGQDRALRFLLARGADIEACDGQGLSPLGAAASKGHEMTVELLLDDGAEIDVTDKKGRTPLHLAIENRHEAVVLRLLRLLQRGCNIECIDQNGFTPLLATAARGQVSVLMMLLKKGAKVSTVAGGRSAVGWAAWAGHDGVIGPLIAAGADMNQPPEQTPLFLAASRGHAMAVKILTEHGVRLDGGERTRALSAAAANGHDTVIKLLSRASTQPLPQPSATSRACPSPSPPYRYRPLAGPSHIRLLELHPASSDDDLLSFTLSQAALSTNPCYQALSYEWGERSGSIPVQCDDGVLLVTPNLHAALKRIRSREGRTVTLWVDAVCINQRDIPERNEQVAMMAKIFKSAESMILWLGDRSDTDTLAPAALGLLAVLRDVYHVLIQSPGWRMHHTTLAPDQTRRISALLSRVGDRRSALAGLWALCDCTYFTRAWILQEMVLATRGVVTWGSHTLDWQAFKEAFWAIMMGGSLETWAHKSHPSAQSTLLTSSHQAFACSEGLQQMLIFTFEKDRAQFQTLEHAVDALADFRAQDPRDKVYAALSLSHPGTTTTTTTTTGPPALQPDYTLTAAQVFTAAAAHMVATSHSLSFWGAHNRRRAKSTPSLPSWVPDWVRSPSAPAAPVDVPSASRPPTYLIHVPADDDDDKRMRTRGASLFLSAHLLDRVACAVPLTVETDVVADVVLPISDFFARRGGDMLGAHRGLGAAAAARGVTNLEALWEVIAGLDRDEEAAREVKSYLAWRVVVGAGRGEEGLDGDLVREMGKWTVRKETEGEGFDGEVYEMMEEAVEDGVDVVVTEKGYFGTTGAGVAGKGMVVAVLEGGTELGLLEEKWDGQTGERFYEYQDEVYALVWADSLDDIEKGAKVEQIEIR